MAAKEPPQHRQQRWAFYVGLVMLGAADILDWPIVAAIGIGHVLAHQHRNAVLAQLGEALEEA